MSAIHATPLQVPSAAFGEYITSFDASVGTFPVTSNQGDWFNTTVAGTVGGQPFIVGDILVALIDSPSTTIFGGNWTIVPNISVTSHLGLTEIGVNTHAQIDTHIANAAVHFTEASITHANIGGLSADDHPNHAYLLGRAGGQIYVAGTAASEELTLRGTTDANLGLIRVQSPIRFEDVSPAVALESFLISDAGVVQSFSAAIVIGGLSFTPTIDFTTAIFFYTAITANPRITSGVNPSFAAFVLFQGLPTLRTVTAGFAPLATLVLNAAPTTECAGVFVAATTAFVLGVSFSPQTRASVAFATMTVSSQTAVSCAPKWSTVANSSVDLGTIRAIHCQVPGPALFQPSAGTEFMDGYIGLDYENINTFGDSADIRVVVRSVLAANTNNHFLLHTGTAVSRISGQLQFPLDLTGITFGLQGDCSIAYAAGEFLFFNYTGFGAGIVGQWRFATATPGTTTARHLWQASVQSAELNINVDRFSFGAQTGAVGNQVGAFVTPARTATIGGGWADFLLTHSANITVDAALSQLFAWSINGPSITIGTGSVTDAGALIIGGAADAGTNRYGLLILSNPTGGTLNYALRVLNGDARFDARVDINNPIALGGGAAPTLGTIGGAGPTVAAQAQWVEIDVGGVPHWVAAWV